MPAPVRAAHEARHSFHPDRLKFSGPTLALLASASAAAGAVHVAVIPAHGDWVAGAAFFAALATFQLGWAASMLRRATPDALRFAVAVNVGALLVWVLSRTSGLPFGPHPGIAESAGRSDVLASVFQAVVVAGAAWTLARPRPAPHRTRAVGVLGAAGIAAAVSVLAVVAIGGASDHRHGHSAGPSTVDSPSDAEAEHAAGHAH